MERTGESQEPYLLESESVSEHDLEANALQINHRVDHEVGGLDLCGGSDGERQNLTHSRDFLHAPQQTLARSISCAGPGIHLGETCRVHVHPAQADTGIRFLRLGNHTVPQTLSIDRVSNGSRCSEVTFDGFSLMTVEHFLAALSGMGVDNAVIEVDGPEIPVMDGSAEPFAALLEAAGLETLDQKRRVLEVIKPIHWADGQAEVHLLPGLGAVFDVLIDFPQVSIGLQEHSFALDTENFRRDISRARTFGTAEELERLRASGLSHGATLANAILVSDDSVENPEGLRFTNEFVRHKILDAVGDFYLLGKRVQGRFVGRRAGHRHHHALLRLLMERRDAWCLVEEPTENFAVSEVPRLSA